MDENSQALYSQYMADIQRVTSENNAWSAEQAQKQMDFQERMSSTAHQREVQDLIAAGLNPVLSAGGSGATTGSGAMAMRSDSNISAMTGLMEKMLEANIEQSRASMVSSAVVADKSRAAQNFENELNLLVKKQGSIKGPSLGKFYDEILPDKAFSSLNSAVSASKYRSGFGSSGRGGSFANTSSSSGNLIQDIIGDNPGRSSTLTKIDLIGLVLPTFANRLRRLYNDNPRVAYILDHVNGDAAFLKLVSALSSRSSRSSSR